MLQDLDSKYAFVKHHLTLSGRKLRVSTGFFDIFPIKFPSSSDNLDRIVI
jgi:hypothetical protein